MRPACPPLVYGCKFLNFSCSCSVDELATRIAIMELEGEYKPLDEYADASTERYQSMVDKIRERLNLTSLQFQPLENLMGAGFRLRQGFGGTGRLLPTLGNHTLQGMVCDEKSSKHWKM